MHDRLQARVQEILGSHQPPALDPLIAREIDAAIEAREKQTSAAEARQR